MFTLLCILATWRLTNLIYTEGGPFDMFDHVRAFLRRWTMPAKMLTCPLCCSVWTAGLVGIFYLLGEYVNALFHWPIYVGGWSGAVCLVYIILDIAHKHTPQDVSAPQGDVLFSQPLDVIESALALRQAMAVENVQEVQWSHPKERIQ